MKLNNLNAVLPSLSAEMLKKTFPLKSSKYTFNNDISKDTACFSFKGQPELSISSIKTELEKKQGNHDFKGCHSKIYVIEQNGRKYAVKVPKDGCGQELQDEINILKELSDIEGVQHYAGSFKFNNKPCLITDFAAGDNLYNVFLKQNYEYNPAQMRNLMRTLRQIEKKGILYADCHPGNIRCSVNGSTPVIIDFGGSKKLENCAEDDISLIDRNLFIKSGSALSVLEARTIGVMLEKTFLDLDSNNALEKSKILMKNYLIAASEYHKSKSKDKKITQEAQETENALADAFKNPDNNTIEAELAICYLKRVMKEIEFTRNALKNADYDINSPLLWDADRIKYKNNDNLQDICLQLCSYAADKIKNSKQSEVYKNSTIQYLKFTVQKFFGNNVKFQHTSKIPDIAKTAEMLGVGTY